MPYIDRIKACNNADLLNFVPVYGRGQRFGWVRQDTTHILDGASDVFVVGGRRVDMHITLFDYDSATEAVANAMERFRAEGHFPNWRGEPYPVAPRFGASPIFTIERAACPMLGIRSWGFHLNGYVRKPDGLHMWIATRAKDKPTYPGLLDNMVAGGQPEGLTLVENVVKECAEEAGMSADMARQAIPVGAITYMHETREGLKPDEMFCYDLELPEDYTPTPVDGEVERFDLLPIEDVMAIVRDTDQFKFNCAAVLIHFFIRHGLINPDNEPDYGEICAGMSQGKR